jgi:hypothetical protein
MSVRTDPFAAHLQYDLQIFLASFYGQWAWGWTSPKGYRIQFARVGGGRNCPYGLAGRQISIGRGEAWAKPGEKPGAKAWAKALGKSLGKSPGQSLGKSLGQSLGKSLGKSLGQSLGKSLGKSLAKPGRSPTPPI